MGDTVDIFFIFYFLFFIFYFLFFIFYFLFFIFYFLFFIFYFLFFIFLEISYQHVMSQITILNTAHLKNITSVLGKIFNLTLQRSKKHYSHYIYNWSLILTHIICEIYYYEKTAKVVRVPIARETRNMTNKLIIEYN
jgi:hypothetical protein